VNRIGDKSRLFSLVLNILETEQFCPVLSARLQRRPSCKLETESRQDKTLFTPHLQTGQNSFEIFRRRLLSQIPSIEGISSSFFVRFSYQVRHLKIKVPGKGSDIAVRNRNHHTAMGNHMP